jgi:transposase
LFLCHNGGMGQHGISFNNWQEARRKRALELKRQGWKQRTIAAAFGVSESAVSKWVANMAGGGTEAWRSKPYGHRPPKLREEQLQRLPERLSHGAEAYGFRGQLWTCARVRAVIREEFGVSYHKAHVARVLKGLKWTPQLPLERASQRDEEAIKRWRVEVWPVLKKRRVNTA